jgi:hypothetical protein
MRNISAFFFMLLLPFETAASTPSLDVTVRPALEDKGYYFSVELKNASKDDILLRRNSLPGVAEGPGALLIKAYSSSNGFLEIEDFGKVTDLVGVKKLSPGEVFTGRINLCLRYPSLERLSSESPIVFLWVFPRNSGGREGALAAGAVVLEHHVKCPKAQS